MIKSGDQTHFWQDCWLEACPLKISFPNPFNIALNPDLEVSKEVNNGRWSIQFQRQFSEPLFEEWENLLELLHNV